VTVENNSSTPKSNKKIKMPYDELLRRRRGEESFVKDAMTDVSLDDEKEKSKKKPSKRSKFTMISMLVFIVAATYFFVDYRDSVSLLNFLVYFLGLSQTVFAVVLDAGSTGSRVLAYTFSRGVFDQQLILRECLFKEVKPGLASFAEDPDAGAATVASLVGLAKSKFPKSSWSDTPVTLMATAGLRLLPSDQSDALIDAVGDVLMKSGFNFKGVGIMSELDEGVFGWMSVNYLLDHLHLPRKSYVALDLGGGSTQITFLPKYKETFENSPSDFLHPVKIQSETQTIYSHSYLGLGLMAAREAIFQIGDASDSLSLKSACLNSTQTFAYAGKTYKIGPDSRPGYDLCMVEVRRMLEGISIHQCAEMPTRKIAAFSYFHDRAVDSGILPSQEVSAVISVQEYLDAAQKECNQPQASEPFLCVDLTYIAGLLHHGYRLDAGAKLGLYRRIAGYDASWGLGAAFNLLE